MKILTKFHGELEIKDTDIFTFESGIPGFLDIKKYTLLSLDETPFFVLQSTTTKDVAFIIMNPFDVFPTYEIDLSQDVLDELHIQTEEDVTVFVILTVREPFEDSTANLQAPVILNTDNKLGKQYIMKTDQYTTRHSFIQPPVARKTGGYKIMLVLTRKLNESIMIGNDIEITILAVEGEKIKLGINAPKQIEIHRKEVYLSIQQENNQAVNTEVNLLTNFSDFFRKK